MEGGGFYTEHSQTQEAYGQLGFEWLEQAAAEVPAVEGGLPFVIADMGAAGGGNSLEPMRRALAARAGKDEPALVVHTDIPSNDFSALFELVDTSPDTYLADGTFALAAGRSFYERLLPAGFMSLGWSSIAVHWMSAAPEPIPEHIYCSFARGAVKKAFEEQSATDWTNFLGNRAVELAPGGRMVIVGGAALEDGSSGAEGLMDLANGVLRKMVAAREIEQAEYGRMTIPTWNRTPAEFTEPFGDGGFEGLELKRHAARSLPDPYLARYKDDGDLDRYTDSVAGFFRAAFWDSLQAGLDHNRGRGNTAKVADHFADRLKDAIRESPEQAACEWHVVVLDIARS